MKKIVYLTQALQLRALTVALLTVLTCSLSCGLVGTQTLHAQQSPQMSMYYYNKMVYNPAYTGARGMLELTGYGRSQWVGIEGHPNTFWFSGQTPVAILRGGLGLNLMSDQIGPLASTAINLSYAYRINIGDKGAALQLGINPGVYFRTLDVATLRPADASDPLLQRLSGNTQTKFDLGLGAYYTVPAASIAEYGEKFFIGVSAQHLLQPKANEIGMQTPLHTYAHAGYRLDFEAGQPLALTPNVLFKMAGPQQQLDLNLNLHAKPMVFGVGYRMLSSDALIAMFGLHISNRLFAAYSYDYTLSALGAASNGSHDIVVTYVIPRSTKFAPPELDTKQNPSVR